MSDQTVKIKGVADVIFLVDCTGSMEPCLTQLKTNITNLASSLAGGNYASVDWRAKVIGYRDVDYDSEPFIGENNPFITDAAGLQTQVNILTHQGGQDEPESALDAIQLAANMPDWRGVGKAHKIIILLTDATTKPTTKDGKDVMEIANDLSSKHFRLLIYAPKASEYELLGKLPKSTFTDISASGDTYEGLANMNWDHFYDLIGKTVSSEIEPTNDSAESTTGTTNSPITNNDDDSDEMISAPDDTVSSSGGKTTEA